MPRFCDVQRYKEKCCRICANTTSKFPCHPQLSCYGSKVIHVLPIYVPLPSPYHPRSVPISRTCIILPSASVVSTSIAPVTNKLESADHLANCKETQALSRDNTSSYQLLLVDVSDLLEHASR